MQKKFMMNCFNMKILDFVPVSHPNVIFFMLLQQMSGMEVWLKAFVNQMKKNYLQA